MKNVIFFVVLAVLTVAALVGWNAVSKQTPAQLATNKVTPTVTPRPTIETGGAVGRTTNGLSDLVDTNNPMASTPAFVGDTKGGVSVKTPAPTAATTPVPTAKVTPQPTAMIQQVSNVVTMSDSGFTNKTITVKAGTMVKFVNGSSNKRMWIQSAAVNGGQALTGFDMGVSVGKDGSYEYQFNQTGTWGYQNKENTTQQASVIVN